MLHWSWEEISVASTYSSAIWVMSLVTDFLFLISFQCIPIYISLPIWDWNCSSRSPGSSPLSNLIRHFHPPHPTAQGKATLSGTCTFLAPGNHHGRVCLSSVWLLPFPFLSSSSFTATTVPAHKVFLHHQSYSWYGFKYCLGVTGDSQSVIVELGPFSGFLTLFLQLLAWPLHIGVSQATSVYQPSNKNDCLFPTQSCSS